MKAQLGHHDMAFNKIWNYISKQFVMHARQCNPIHVFVRNFDKASVLMKIELKEIEKIQKEQKIKFCWHVLFGDKRKEIMALDPATHTLKEESRETQYYFKTRHAAEIAQRAYLMNKYRGDDVQVTEVTDKSTGRKVEVSKETVKRTSDLKAGSAHGQPYVSPDSRKRALYPNVGGGKTGW